MGHLILETAEPFFFPGGGSGCLLVHGFTGTPREMRPLGEYLAGQGHAVLGLRLTGHATRPEDLLRARWEDWLADLETGWRLLAGVSDQIYVLGLSLGGALSLLFAARYPVAGVVAMSAPYALRDDPRLPYAEILSHLMPRIPKGPMHWRDAAAASRHVEYPYYPSRALAEVRDLLVAMRDALPQVTVPALLVHARGDSGGDAIDPESMPKIYNRLGSAGKEMLWLENSGHVITLDQERSKLFAAISDFITRGDARDGMAADPQSRVPGQERSGPAPSGKQGDPA